MSNAISENKEEAKLDPVEAANLFRAFIECSRDMQEIVLEMSEIIADEKSSDDERQLAGDTMFEALFPGMATDVLERYKERVKSPAAAEVAVQFRNEEKHFSERVRDLMLKKNITQEQLAKDAGISQPAVSNILKRRCRPQRRTIERFATILDVAPSELWPQWSQTEAD